MLARPGRALGAAIGAALLGAMFLVFVVQIVARFGFGRPLPWTDELAVILYVWVVLWAAAFMVPVREHVAFDLLYQSAGPRVRRVMRAAAALLVGGLAAWAIPGSWDYVRFMAREGTPVIGVPFMWVYLPFMALLVAIVARSARELWGALRGEHSDDSADDRAPGMGRTS